MPIDPERNIIFIHIPRTAGSSIEHMLGMHGQRKLHNIGPLPILANTKSPQHFTYRELRAVIEPVRFKGAYKFSFVRNPWDRLVSEFHWCRRRAARMPRQLLACTLRNLETFDSFVDRVVATDPMCRRDWLSGFDGHIDSQLSYLSDDSGSVNLDFLGRFESYREDVTHLCNGLKVAVDLLPHLNRTDHGPYRSYYSEKTKRYVKQMYEEDIETFGYVF